MNKPLLRRDALLALVVMFVLAGCGSLPIREATMLKAQADQAAANKQIMHKFILMEFLTFEATYTGDYMGRQVKNMPIKYNQVEMARLADGKIVEWWVEMDRLWMAEQIGFELGAK